MRPAIRPLVQPDAPQLLEVGIAVGLLQGGEIAAEVDSEAGEIRAHRDESPDSASPSGSTSAEIGARGRWLGVMRQHSAAVIAFGGCSLIAASGATIGKGRRQLDLGLPSNTGRGSSRTVEPSIWILPPGRSPIQGSRLARKAGVPGEIARTSGRLFTNRFPVRLDHQAHCIFQRMRTRHVVNRK